TRRAVLDEEPEGADPRLEVEVGPGGARIERELRPVRPGLDEEAALAAGQVLDVLRDEGRDVAEGRVERDRVVADGSGDGHLRWAERVEPAQLRLEAGERLVPVDPRNRLARVVLPVLVRVEPEVVRPARPVDVDLLDLRRRGRTAALRLCRNRHRPA